MVFSRACSACVHSVRAAVRPTALPAPRPVARQLHTTLPLLKKGSKKQAQEFEEFEEDNFEDDVDAELEASAATPIKTGASRSERFDKFRAVVQKTLATPKHTLKTDVPSQRELANLFAQAAVEELPEALELLARWRAKGLAPMSDKTVRLLAQRLSQVAEQDGGVKGVEVFTDRTTYGADIPSDLKGLYPLFADDRREIDDVADQYRVFLAKTISPLLQKYFRAQTEGRLAESSVQINEKQGKAIATTLFVLGLECLMPKGIKFGAAAAGGEEEDKKSKKGKEEEDGGKKKKGSAVESVEGDEEATPADETPSSPADSSSSSSPSALSYISKLYNTALLHQPASTSSDALILLTTLSAAARVGDLSSPLASQIISQIQQMGEEALVQQTRDIGRKWRDVVRMRSRVIAEAMQREGHAEDEWFSHLAESLHGVAAK